MVSCSSDVSVVPPLPSDNLAHRKFSRSLHTAVTDLTILPSGDAFKLTPYLPKIQSKVKIVIVITYKIRDNKL